MPRKGVTAVEPVAVEAVVHGRRERGRREAQALEDARAQGVSVEILDVELFFGLAVLAADVEPDLRGLRARRHPCRSDCAHQGGKAEDSFVVHAALMSAIA